MFEFVFDANPDVANFAFNAEKFFLLGLQMLFEFERRFKFVLQLIYDWLLQLLNALLPQAHFRDFFAFGGSSLSGFLLHLRLLENSLFPDSFVQLSVLLAHLFWRQRRRNISWRDFFDGFFIAGRFIGGAVFVLSRRWLRSSRR